MQATLSKKVTKTPEIRLTHEEMLSEITQQVSRLNDEQLVGLARELFRQDFDVVHSSKGSYFFGENTNKRLSRYLIQSIDIEISSIATKTYQEAVAQGCHPASIKPKIRIALVSSGTPFNEPQLLSAVDKLMKGESL